MSFTPDPLNGVKNSIRSLPRKFDAVPRTYDELSTGKPVSSSKGRRTELPTLLGHHPTTQTHVSHSSPSVWRSLVPLGGGCFGFRGHRFPHHLPLNSISPQFALSSIHVPPSINPSRVLPFRATLGLRPTSSVSTRSYFQPLGTKSPEIAPFCAGIGEKLMALAKALQGALDSSPSRPA